MTEQTFDISEIHIQDTFLPSAKGELGLKAQGFAGEGEQGADRVK